MYLVLFPSKLFDTMVPDDHIIGIIITMKNINEFVLALPTKESQYPEVK